MIPYCHLFPDLAILVLGEPHIALYASRSGCPFLILKVDWNSERNQGGWGDPVRLRRELLEDVKYHVYYMFGGPGEPGWMRICATRSHGHLNTGLFPLFVVSDG
jgi:hypothetical protein